MIQLLLGIAMAYAGLNGHSSFSPVLFVEGMILANHALLGKFKSKSLNHL